VEAEGVRIKATAADIRDTIHQGLQPHILHSVMQHELGDRLADIRKWAKMAQRYGSTTNNGADISEIKSTLNDLATRLERTQFRAVTPERRSVQFTKTPPIKMYSREPSPAPAPRAHNFDPETGRKLADAGPKFDTETGVRI